MEIVSVLLISAGGRNTIYSKLLKLIPEKAKVVGIAEPREFFRNRLAKEHDVPEEMLFDDWEAVAKLPKFADAVIIATQDRMHVEPAKAFADKGYHILIEKPLAPDAEGCKEIVDAAAKNNVMLSVCHVMRYNIYTTMIKDLIAKGDLGQIMSMQHVEPVGHLRFAHSYVRGNWSREEDSSSLLLAKSVHDLDWLAFIADSRCTKISSFGSLMFFNEKNQPKGGAERCQDCAQGDICPYNAQRSYINRLRAGLIDNYLESVTSDLTEEGILEALKTGPYGRCVFKCDNDVVDHQVVNMEFESGATAVFTVVGCSEFGERRTTIFGTAGELRCDGLNLEVYSYLTKETTVYPIPQDDGTIEMHHNGGDLGCLYKFIDAVREHNPSILLSDGEISLQTHMMVFNAELSRLTGKLIETP